MWCFAVDLLLIVTCLDVSVLAIGYVVAGLVFAAGVHLCSVDVSVVGCTVCVHCCFRGGWMKSTLGESGRTSLVWGVYSEAIIMLMINILMS